MTSYTCLCRMVCFTFKQRRLQCLTPWSYEDVLIHVCVHTQLLSRVLLFATSWTVAHQAPLSMGFSRQDYWSGLPYNPPGDLPNPGIEPRSPALWAEALTSEPPGKPHIRMRVGFLSFPSFIEIWLAYNIVFVLDVYHDDMICLYITKWSPQ